MGPLEAFCCGVNCGWTTSLLFDPCFDCWKAYMALSALYSIHTKPQPMTKSTRSARLRTGVEPDAEWK